MQFTNPNVPPRTGFVLKYKRLKLEIVVDSGNELSSVASRAAYYQIYVPATCPKEPPYNNCMLYFRYNL